MILDRTTRAEMCRISANGGKAEVREVAENGGHKMPSRTGIVLGHGCCERCESGQGFSPGQNFREEIMSG